MPNERWRNSYDNWKLASPDDEVVVIRGDCDCCDRQNVPLARTEAHHIETFACEDCRS
jgi:hypothetical protein